MGVRGGQGVRSAGSQCGGEQGFSGWDGVSQCHRGPADKGMGGEGAVACGLRLNLTVVAVNDAPSIDTPRGLCVCVPVCVSVCV